MPTPYADQAGYTNSDESYAEGGGPNQGANVGSGGYEHTILSPMQEMGNMINHPVLIRTNEALRSDRDARHGAFQ